MAGLLYEGCAERTGHSHPVDWAKQGRLKRAPAPKSALFCCQLRRRRLYFLLRQAWIECRPARRHACPDRDFGLGDLGIVERAGAHAAHMRPRLRPGEHVRPAFRAELTVHLVAAVGDALIVAEFPLDLDLIRREEDVDRSAAGTDFLAQPAPTNPRDDRLRRDLVAHRPAQTSAGGGHVILLCARRDLPLPARGRE